MSLGWCHLNKNDNQTAVSCVKDSSVFSWPGPSKAVVISIARPMPVPGLFWLSTNWTLHRADRCPMRHRSVIFDWLGILLSRAFGHSDHTSICGLSFWFPAPDPHRTDPFSEREQCTLRRTVGWTRPLDGFGYQEEEWDAGWTGPLSHNSSQVSSALKDFQCAITYRHDPSSCLRQMFVMLSLWTHREA